MYRRYPTAEQRLLNRTLLEASLAYVESDTAPS